MSAKILFLAGSTRAASTNKKLARSAFNIATKLGVNATFIDLKDYDMPLYNGDIEAESGLPEQAKALKKVFAEHDGIFIASPEYNGSFSALLKNALDWISRPHEKDEPRFIAFNNKVAAIAAASPGALGGLRGLVPVRMLLGNLSLLVIPEQLALANAYQAFDDIGNLKDDTHKTTLTAMINKMVKVIDIGNANHAK